MKKGKMVFIGRDGTRYTSESICRMMKEKGSPIKRQLAWHRMKRVCEDHTYEPKLLKRIIPRIVVNHKGDRWTIKKLAKFAVRYKGVSWARKKLLAVLNKKLTMETVLKQAKEIATKGVQLTFRGKPTEDYPKGRVYTTRIIKDELKRLYGQTIADQPACYRMRIVIKNPEREDFLLAPIRQGRQIKENTFVAPGMTREDLALEQLEKEMAADIALVMKYEKYEKEAYEKYRVYRDS